MPYADAQRRHALLATRAFVASVLAVSATPAMAECNSGNVGDMSLVSSAGCKASAPAADSVAIGAAARAEGERSTAVGQQAGQASADGSFANSSFWLKGRPRCEWR